MMKRKRRKRGKSGVKVFIGFIILSSVCGLVFLAFLLSRMVDVKQKDEKIADMETFLDSNRHNVFVATRNLEAGEILTEDMVELKTIISEAEIYTYLDQSQFGGIVLVNVPAGTPLTQELITQNEVTDDMRLMEFTTVKLMADAKERDYVDIRIHFANGEDYLVLSKKKICSLDSENGKFCTYVTEEESMRMSSALTDAYTYKGTKIYTTLFAESSLQKEAKPNYPIRAVVTDIMKKSKDIELKAMETLDKSVRKNLEDRLSLLDKETTDAMQTGYDSEDEVRDQSMNTTQENATDSE
jgi:hypothetical protein